MSGTTPPSSRENGLKKFALSVNWVGVIAGALMLIIPFMGAWWKAAVGTGAMKIAFSPFHYEVILAGQSITSSLVSYFILASQLTVLIGGILMIAGSLTAMKWWGRKLVDWGSKKVLWMLVLLVALILIGTVFMNKFLPSLLSKVIGGDVELTFSLPYLIGSGSASIGAQEAVKINAPVTMELTSSFWLAIATAVAGYGAKVYHGRLLERSEVSEEGEEVEESPEKKTETDAENNSGRQEEEPGDEISESEKESKS